MSKTLVPLFQKLRNWIVDHQVRAGALAGWYQQACGAVAALVAIPLVIKNLGSSDAGLWFSFQSILAIITLTDFGLSFVISRQVAYSLTATTENFTGDSDFIPHCLGWTGVGEVYEASRRLFRWVSFGGLLILVFLYHVVLPLGKLLPAVTADTTIAWYLLGAATLVSLQAKPHQAVLEGLAKLYVTRFLSGTFQLASGFGAVAVLLWGGGLKEMALVVSIASACNYAVIRWLVKWQVGPRLPPVSQLPEGLLRQFLRISAPMGILNLSAFCVSSIQVPLIGSLLGPKVVPAFYLAQRIGQVLNQAVTQLVQPQLPLFTQDLAAGNTQGARQRMKETIVWVTGLAVAVNAFFFLFSPVLAQLWVGPSHYVTRPVLLLMSIDYLILSAAVVWGLFVLASGTNPFVFSTVMAGILNVGLCAAVVPTVGMIGVPMATLIAGLCTNYWYVVYRGILCLRTLRIALCTR
jgi:O-antigen/teichoic acid export membrane protein